MRVPDLPFFKGLSDKDVQEFVSIAKNTTLPKNEIEAKEADWATEKKIREQYDEFVQNVTDTKSEVHRIRTDLVNQLNSKMDELEGIEDDKTLTLPEVANKTAAFWATLKTEDDRLARAIFMVRNLTGIALFPAVTQKPNVTPMIAAGPVTITMKAGSAAASASSTPQQNNSTSV
ncbi:unnamed protein product, partial [Mesorhabditis spiculigera]